MIMVRKILYDSESIVVGIKYVCNVPSMSQLRETMLHWKSNAYEWWMRLGNQLESRSEIGEYELWFYITARMVCPLLNAGLFH